MKAGPLDLARTLAAPLLRSTVMAAAVFGVGLAMPAAIEGVGPSAWALVRLLVGIGVGGAIYVPWTLLAEPGMRDRARATLGRLSGGKAPGVGE